MAFSQGEEFQQIAKKRAGTPHPGRMPYIGSGEDVRVVKARWSLVKLVAAGSVERECRVTSIEAGDAFAEWKIIQTLGVCIVGQNCKPMKHPLFNGSLK